MASWTKAVSVLVLVFGCTGGSRPASGPDASGQGACPGLNEADCAHASSCHATFTSDLPCNSACCASHFEACEDGATANCDGHRTGVCNGSCVMTTPSCDGSLVDGYSEDGCCPGGCVAISQCAGVTVTASQQCPSGHEVTLPLPGGAKTACDPGDLSQLGPQGCPAP
jgi:hypothetical protein